MSTTADVDALAPLSRMDTMQSIASRILTPFANRGEVAPYEVSGKVYGNFGVTLRVVPVRCKTKYAASRARKLIHRVTEVAAIVHGNRIRYAARWLCGDGSVDAILVADPDPYGGVCFRCAGAEERGPLVYRLYDRRGSLLYIGSTINVFGRFQGHAGRTPWWSEVATYRLQRFETEEAARCAEALAIGSEDPKHNKIYRRSRSEVAS